MSAVRAHRLRALALLVFLAVVMFPTAPTQERDERAVRVAYLYTLIKFVDWPNPQNDLLIGFVGSPATG